MASHLPPREGITLQNLLSGEGGRAKARSDEGKSENQENSYGRGDSVDALEMRKRAQELRKTMTLEERTLWYQYLRTYPVQWNRQKVFGKYIVDFYCKRAKLVLELDGSQHFEPDYVKQDAVRTQYLNSLGLHVLRFTNLDVKNNLRGVCQCIDEADKHRMSRG